MKRLMLIMMMGVITLSLAACGEESDTPITDDLESPAVDGQSFLSDGLGKVDLHACRDGDTADFEEDGEIFRVRFLALDTPESGHIYEPWGLPASEVACEIMRDAEDIVLEFDEGAGNRRGNYGRYLAFIWVDGRNLNLELIERGYSPAQGAGSYAYATELMDADTNAREAGLGIYGDDNDPTYPYDAAVEDATIESLITGDYEDNFLKRFNVEGVVQARIGGHTFIEDPQTGHGIFVFAHYNAHNNRMTPGNHVRLNGFQFYRDGKPFQSFFLTDYDTSRIDVIESGLDVSFDSMDISAIGEADYGKVRTFSDLTITDFSGDEMSMTAEDEDGETITIHQLGVDYIDGGLFPRASRISEWQSVDTRDLEVGDTITLTAAISERREHGTTLILLGDSHFTLHD